jgi:hypothetical protein
MDRPWGRFENAGVAQAQALSASYHTDFTKRPRDKAKKTAVERRAEPWNLRMHMKADNLQRYLCRARQRFGDQLLTWLTILLAAFTFMIVPLHAAGLIVVHHGEPP